MIDPGTVLSLLASLAMRFVAWLVPRQEAIDGAVMDYRLAITSADAISGARREAQERCMGERQEFERQRRIRAIEVAETVKAAERAQEHFDAQSVLHDPGKIPGWHFLRRRRALKEFRRAADRITGLNEIQSECGGRFHPFADDYAHAARALKGKRTTAATDNPAHPETAHRGKDRRNTLATA